MHPHTVSVVDRAPAAGLNYRPDVDGLRAVAVLAVIGFHAAPRLVPGGFVGVDVFFVISGFLISGLLFKEFDERGAFDPFEFYARRIRRIFPALILVLAACWAFGWLVLVRSEFAELQGHIASASVFVPNFALWGESGYFDRPSELKPLLHLWSLGIEEQFYLFWPPLAYVCWKRRLNLLSTVLVIVGVSFALNVILVGKFATATFYLPHSRIWELLVGACLAYLAAHHHDGVDGMLHRIVFAPGTPARRDSRTVPNVTAWLGAVLVLAAVFGYAKSVEFPGWWRSAPPLRAIAAGLGLDSGMIYPGWWAAVPVLGTALLIWAGPSAFVNRTVLGRRAVVYVGLMSYPLYLWHWPALAYVRITESGNPSVKLRTMAIAIAAVLAWLTYELVERPVRRRVTARTPVRVFAIAGVLVAIGGAAFVAGRAGLTSRTPQFATAVDDYFASPRHDTRCNQRFPTDGEYCQVYSETLPVTTALLGDSHAEHYLHGVGAHLNARGENVVHLGNSGCPPLLDIQRLLPGTEDTCIGNRSVVEYAANAPAIATVLIAFRGTVDVTGKGFGPAERNIDVTVRLAGTTLPAAEALRRALGNTVDYLASKQKSVWLLMQVPELDFAVDECAGRPISFEHSVRTPCAVPRAAVDARQAPYRAVIDEVRREHPALNVFDPLPLLCDAQWCYGVRDGQLLYRDGNHLSRTGSLFFADKFPF